MGYKEALEETGAHVLEYETFGSYQGDWFAVVNYNNQIYLIRDSYGSCSGCDAFEAEMGYSSSDTPEYKQKLIAFGEGYLDTPADIDAELEKFNNNISWDESADEIVKFLERVKKTYKLGGKDAN